MPVVVDMKISHACLVALFALGACRGGPSAAQPRQDAAAPASEASDTLQVGSAAPAFRLTAHDGSTFSLADAVARGPVVVVFYRGHW